jgi:protein O-GlcNAc transferase
VEWIAARASLDESKHVNANRSRFPLFDTGRFARNLEAAYQAIWERAQRGEPPRSFAVESTG